MPRYLFSLSGIYYFRMRIPEDLRKLLGKREFKKSLKTSDKRVAERMAAIFAVQADYFYQTLRGRLMARDLHLNTFFVEGFRRKPDGEISIKKLQSDPNRPVEEESKLIKQFFEHLSSLENASAQQKTTQAVMGPASPGILLSNAIDAYCREAKITNSWGDGYTQQVRESLSKLVRVLGDQDVSGISRDNAVSFFETIQKLPPNMNKVRLYRNASIEQILKMDIRTKIDPKTVKDTMSRIRGFSAWLYQQKHSEEDLFSGLMLKNVKKSKRSRRKKEISRFYDSELSTIFSQRIFTDHEFLWPYMYAVRTVESYIDTVRVLANYYHRSPDLIYVRPQQVAKGKARY